MRRLLIATAFVAAVASQAMPADQHHIQFYGRPQVFDVNPPTSPYLEITATTFTASPQTTNGMEQMYGGCTQVIRLSPREARAIAERLSEWLLAPEEETLLFDKRLYGGLPTATKSADQQR
jgi:hypothetical protein